jgi:putative nucleotidyltransferase with HDIG domain
MGLLNRLDTVEGLPTLPETVMKVQALICSDSGDAAALAHIIEEDPALAAKILKIANSSFYTATHKRISSIKIAVSRLGFQEVWSISMAMSLIRHFSRRKGQLGYTDFWKHSIEAAYLAQTAAALLSIHYTEVERQELFMAGLFHDIGILVLDQFFPEVFEKIMEETLAGETSFTAAEKMVVGKETHPITGGALLELWKLPQTVIESVRSHHNPEKCPENFKKFAIPLSITEYVLCNGRIGAFEGAIDEECRKSWSIYDISPEFLPQLFTISESPPAISETIVTMDKPTVNSPLASI